MQQKSPLHKLNKNLHKSPEVQKSVQKSEQYKSLQTKKDKALLLTKNNDQFTQERLDIHLERYATLFDRGREGNQDDSQVERNVAMLKRAAAKKYVVKPEEIPERVYQLEQEIAFNQGHGHIEITEEYKKKKNEEIINNQTKSLSRWVDYLTGPDAFYEPWFKYYAFEAATKMGMLDKKKWSYKQRKVGDGTVAPFPELNAEALVKTQSLLKEKFESGNQEILTQLAQGDEEATKKIQQILDSGQFRKIYPMVQKKLLELRQLSQEQRENIKGSWKKYHQGTDEYMALSESLQEYSTGWCTAGENTAKSQLQQGDFYVFYSEDHQGDEKIPRIAIRMAGDEIAEIRGVGDAQELEPEMYETMEEKAKTLGGYSEYRKKVEDMRRVTEMYNNPEQELTLDDIVFLREVHQPIESFGYDTDPRIEEILKGRSASADYQLIVDKYESGELALEGLKVVKLKLYVSAHRYIEHENSDTLDLQDWGFASGFEGDALYSFGTEDDGLDWISTYLREEQPLYKRAYTIDNSSLKLDTEGVRKVQQYLTRYSVDSINPLSRFATVYEESAEELVRVSVHSLLNEMGPQTLLDFAMFNPDEKIRTAALKHLPTPTLFEYMQTRGSDAYAVYTILESKGYAMDPEVIGRKISDWNADSQERFFKNVANIDSWITDIPVSVLDSNARYLAGNSTLSEVSTLLEQLGEEGLEEFLKYATQHHRTLANSPDVNIRADVARFSSDSRLLHDMSRDEHFRVRKAVAQNKDAEQLTLQILASDSKNSVKQAAKASLADR